MLCRRDLPSRFDNVKRCGYQDASNTGHGATQHIHGSVIVVVHAPLLHLFVRNEIGHGMRHKHNQAHPIALVESSDAFVFQDAGDQEPIVVAGPLRLQSVLHDLHWREQDARRDFSSTA